MGSYAIENGFPGCKDKGENGECANFLVEAFLEGEVVGYEESRWCAMDVVDGMATGRLLLWGMSGRRRLCPSTPTARVYALAMGEWMKSGWSR